MSFSKAARAIKPLVKEATELMELVVAEGEKSDRENARIKELALDIIANWETVAQYEEDIARFAEHGPRTKAEELTAKNFYKNLRKLGGALWKARTIDDFVLEPKYQEMLKAIRGDVKRWKGLVKKAPKRTAAAERGAGEGGEKTKDKGQKRGEALA